MPDPYQTALARIRAAAESGATTLDLSGLWLTSLPPEIGELTALTQLNLRENQLTSLPPEIGRLTALTELNLSFNQLTSLPPEIGHLTALTKLNLNQNQLTSLPPEIGRLTTLTELFLVSNQLTSLPPEIGTLTALTELYLRENQLTSLPPEIGALTALTGLNLSYNQLTSLPPELWRLPNLKRLNISANPLPLLPPEIWQKTDWEALGLSGLDLTSLPPEIGELTVLTELYLGGNRLASLPPEIGALTALTTLDLYNNQLTSLPPEIGELTALTELDLSWNQLTSLPPEIGRLTALTKLDLESNQLTSLPPEIGALTALTELDLWFNRLTSLPPEIGELANLQTLNLQLNQLTSLPPEIGNLTALTKLDLYGNQLTSLPPEIGELANLQTFDLRQNQLPSLPPEIGELANLQTFDLRQNQLPSLPPEIGNLTALTGLNLSYNQLTSLPPELGNLTRLEGLSLHGNPLELALPRALLGKEWSGGDAQAIFRFYRAIWEEGQALGEARLLFVGPPGAGKTSLAYRLVDGSYLENRPSTLTVETHSLPLVEFTAQVWDFGGQDYMHATHPVFFSARCVYVLVFNVRHSYEQNRVEYWLRTLRAYGGDSPVIVVGNHADARGHLLDLPQNRLRREFPNIAAFVQTSAHENNGIEDLRAALHEAVESLPHVRVLFARPHLAVKAALEEAKRQQNIIPYAEYRKRCAEQGIEDEEDQDTLLRLLHDLGVVLDFRDEAGEPLSPDGVLNPNWVTDAVYRLITDHEVRGETCGRLTPSIVRRVLHEYAPYHRSLILKLLERFELAYPAEDGSWYLPNAMPQDEPPAASDSAWADALAFEYTYPELPESVITRFIVRAHAWLEAGGVWRWGAILGWNANRALVRASVAEKKIEIRVGGPEHTRRDFLTLLRAHFDVIHKTFTESAGKEAFPITAWVCPPRYPALRLEYEKLLTYERDGIAQIPETWQGRTIYLNVSEVLNGFSTPEVRAEERKRLFPEEERMKQKDEKSIHIEVKGSMQGSTLIIGEGNQVTQTVQHSFNTPSNPELAPLLAQLTAAVEAMLQHLPKEQAAEAREDLARLQEELQKPEPRRKWYRVSIEGLIKAAENLGKLGAPVIELAGKLLKLL